MRQKHLFTIGYEDRKIDDFISKLQNNDIKVLIDIREIPISRKPGFSKSKLKGHLESAGIGYIHVKDLGSPKQLRRKLTDNNDYDLFFEEYNIYLQTRMDTVNSIYHDVILNETSCLMCMEREPIYCHRNVVAKKIKEIDGNGLNIKHI